MKKGIQFTFAILVIAASLIGLVLAALNFKDVSDAHKQLGGTLIDSLKDTFNVDTFKNIKIGSNDLDLNVNISFWSSVAAFSIGGLSTITGFYLLYAAFAKKETHLVVTILFVIIGAVALTAGALAFGYHDSKLANNKFFDVLKGSLTTARHQFTDH